MTDLWNLTQNELADFIKTLGYPAYRAKQIREWMLKGTDSFGEMLNLPAAMRNELECSATVALPTAVKEQRADDGTIKALWRLCDGSAVEAVLMRYKHGDSVCLSTQVGCKMNCAFCASAIGGFVRNLTTGEMTALFVAMEKLAGHRVGRLVLMGTGEPLDNLNNVISFLKQITSVDGLNLSARHISVSTCGLPDGIARLARSGIPVTLSVSLHAPDDETRSKLMPVNRRYDIAAVLKAADEYFEITSRRVSYEYILIDRLNDGRESAKLLAERLRGRAAHVNLIACNPVSGKPFAPSTRTEEFRAALESAGIAVTVRRRLGRGIDAACGQLKFSKEANL